MTNDAVLVIDASGVLRVLKRDVDARRVAERLASEDALHAPHLIDLEILSALRRMTRTGEVSLDRAAEMRKYFGDLPIIRYPHEPFSDRIWRLRSNVSAYDAAYVAIAEVLDAVLVTCDAKLAATVPDGIEVELFRSEAPSRP